MIRCNYISLSHSSLSGPHLVNETKTTLAEGEKTLNTARWGAIWGSDCLYFKIMILN